MKIQIYKNKPNWSRDESEFETTKIGVPEKKKFLDVDARYFEHGETFNYATLEQYSTREISNFKNWIEINGEEVENIRTAVISEEVYGGIMEDFKRIEEMNKEYDSLRAKLPKLIRSFNKKLENIVE